MLQKRKNGDERILEKLVDPVVPRAGVFGAVLYAAGFPAATGPTDLFLRLIGNPWPAVAGKHLHFAFGLMGAITIGWMITFYILCRAAWSLDDAAARPIWRGAALSISV